jgi:lipopolysaccharide export LptBFGC system permease protein LptF
VLTEQPKDFAALEKKVTEMDVNELYRYTARLERDGYQSTSYRVDLYSRFSLALTPLILVMLGLGLALRHEQIHLTSMVAVGLGLMFVYWLFLDFAPLSARPVAFRRCWPPLPLIWPSARWPQCCCAR